MLSISVKIADNILMKKNLIFALFFICFNAHAVVIVIGGELEERHEKDKELIESVAKSKGQDFYFVDAIKQGVGKNPSYLKENLAKTLDEIKSKLIPGEPLIIQFTGHGFMADPKDPGASGVAVGTAGMLSFDEIGDLLVEKVPKSTTTKMIATTCFGGGVHDISRKLNASNPGGACSVSTTSHITTSNVQNQEEHPTAFSGSFWNKVKYFPKSTNMVELYSETQKNIPHQSEQYGTNSLGSSDSLHFYNKRGTHNPELLDDYYNNLYINEKNGKYHRQSMSFARSYKRADYINAHKLVEKEAYDPIWKGEFGELQSFNDDLIKYPTQNVYEQADEFYNNLMKKDHPRRAEQWYTYIGTEDYHIPINYYDKEFEIQVTDTYQCSKNVDDPELDSFFDSLSEIMIKAKEDLSPSDQLRLYLERISSRVQNQDYRTKATNEYKKMQTDLASTITAYGQEKLKLVQACVDANEWSDSDLSNEEKLNKCEHGKVGNKEYKVKLSQLESKFRTKFDHLKDLWKYPYLRNMKFYNAEIKRVNELISLNKNLKSTTQKNNLNRQIKCETEPFL